MTATTVDAEAVVAATLACPPVAAMAASGPGEVATYLPGKRISGVRIDDDVIEVHLVARWGADLPMLGNEVRAAVGALAGGRRVDVFVDDILLPQEGPSAAGPQPLPPGDGSS